MMSHRKNRVLRSLLGPWSCRHMLLGSIGKETGLSTNPISILAPKVWVEWVTLLTGIRNVARW